MHMKLTPDHLNTLTDCAIEAARAAGEHIAQTRPLNVQRKSGGDSFASQVLTEVDGQSQEIILQILEPTLAQFDLALLTEESEDDQSRQEKDSFWCIDPIDGTLPFIEGVPGYSVSIALVSHEGIPQIGVVFDPVEGTLYHAIRGAGAFRNSKHWNPDLRDHGSRLQLFTDRSFAEQASYPQILQTLEIERSTAQGGAVMNACWVLENAPACYFKFPKSGKGGGSLWDFAATACIFHEVGAVASDIHGNPLDLNRPGSTFMNHRGILFATDSDLAQKIIAYQKNLALNPPN